MPALMSIASLLRPRFYPFQRAKSELLKKTMCFWLILPRSQFNYTKIAPKRQKINKKALLKPDF